MKTWCTLFLFLFMCTSYGKITAQEKANVDEVQSNDLWKFRTDLYEEPLIVNDFKFHSELLASPYSINNHGICNDEIGQLYIRIKPLELKGVSPMPGAHGSKIQSKEHCYSDVSP